MKRYIQHELKYFKKIVSEVSILFYTYNILVEFINFDKMWNTKREGSEADVSLLVLWMFWNIFIGLASKSWASHVICKPGHLKCYL